MGFRFSLAGCCYFLLAVQETLGRDDVSLLQQSVSPHMEAGIGSLEAAFKEAMSNEETQKMIRMAPKYAKMMDQVAPKASLLSFARGVRQEATSHKAVLRNGWETFFNRSRKSNPGPESLLHNAKVALLETGAMENMRQMAFATANRSKALSGGIVPLDSMIVGFKTSIAPWNNLLKAFSFPLIKTAFSMFVNFFGPEGNAARLCISAEIAVDSTYGVHSEWEFGGINVFVGPAKFDNVPGWHFGASGGLDDLKYFDASDFGWWWTLSAEPETLGFFYDVNLADSEGLHPKLLQTGSHISGKEEDRKADGIASHGSSIASHGSSFIGHTWCSPDWDNTPLVVEPPANTMVAELATKTEEDLGKAQLVTSESWDPVTEAV